MKWNRWYVTRSYVRSALWLVPLVSLLLEQVAIRVVGALDVPNVWVPQLSTTPGGSIAEMDTIITLTISFTAFTFGSMLVAIQVASAQLTPRIIATTLLRDNTIRFAVGLFVFTLLFAAGTRAQIVNDIPQLAVNISVVLGIASLMVFLYLIDYTARLLRPISIVRRVGEQGLTVIEDVYPKAADKRDEPVHPRQPLGPPKRIIEHHGNSAIVIAANLKGLVTLAQRCDGVIEVVPRVGDFIAAGESLFRLYGGAAEIDDRRLSAQVAFGPERTIEQDALFAFRVIVDVAIRAQAINDPTTAVLAIDQLHLLLRSVGSRHLHNDALYGADGKLRLVFPTPDWKDFVELTFSELRFYGADSFQIARRLRALIESVASALPRRRKPALDRELNLLDRTLEKLHTIPENLELARQPDLQGLGGASTALVGSREPAVI